jgi:hypothetical protein
MVQTFILLWMRSTNILLCGLGQVKNGLIFCHSKFCCFLLTDAILNSIIFRYYVEPASIVICGQPSASLADKLEKDEKARIAAQVDGLGPEGLKKAETELEAAKAEHERTVPIEILTSFPVPDVKSISWLPVQSVQEPGIGRKLVYRALGSSPLSKYIDSDGKPVPFFVEYDHVEVCSDSLIFLEHELNFLFSLHQSDFVTVHGCFSLAKLPNRLRP